MLRQTEPLSRFRLVVGIENLADRFRRDFLLDRLVVIADVEGLQVERSSTASDAHSRRKSTIPPPYPATSVSWATPFTTWLVPSVLVDCPAQS